jgi:ribonuclease J
MYVDGVDIGEPDDAALRDRREISADGIFIVVVTISSDDASVVADPEVIFRGVAFLDDANALIEDISDLVEDSIEATAKSNGAVRDPNLVEEDLHAEIGKFVWQRLRRRPMIVPVVVEV